MIWIILIAVIAFIAYKFLSSLDKDKQDLQGKTLNEKFNVIVYMLNESAFNHNGNITNFDQRQFNLYEEGSNQIIQFHYSTGALTIIWKYKYLQKEVVHERTFDDVRNLSLFEQQKIAQNLINEMAVVISNHKINVFGGAF